MRRKLRRSDIYDEFKEKKKNPLIPIILFFGIITILSLTTFWIINVIADNTEDVIYDNKDKPTQSGKKPTASKDKMDLIVPVLMEGNNTIYNDYFNLKFTDIKANESGYVITASLTSFVDYVTIEIRSMNIDGFYVSTKFAISDRSDSGNWDSQVATTHEFRIDKSELDELGIFGFNNIGFVYDFECPHKKSENLTFYLVGTNSIQISNERKGLVQIDSTDNMVVSYYKTVEDTDYTYVYFDFKNKSDAEDYTILLKSLEINGKKYELSGFEHKIYRKSEHAIYLPIPKSDFSKISSINVSFFVLQKQNSGKINYVYYTTEYTRTY